MLDDNNVKIRETHFDTTFKPPTIWDVDQLINNMREMNMLMFRNFVTFPTDLFNFWCKHK